MIEEHIKQLIEPTLQDMGYDVVRVRMIDSGHRTLQIMAERQSDFDLGIKDCEKISHAISAILDIEDPIKDEYHLEISSPGIDRPLVTLGHFQEYIGFDAKVSVHEPVEGRKKFKGKICSTNDDSVVEIEQEDSKKTYPLPLENIASAQLVLTDALMNYSQKKHKKS